jgi:hypothetical protein
VGQGPAGLSQCAPSGPDADRNNLTKSVGPTPPPRKSLRRKEIVVGEEGLEPSFPYGKRILSLLDKIVQLYRRHNRIRCVLMGAQ